MVRCRRSVAIAPLSVCLCTCTSVHEPSSQQSCCRCRLCSVLKAQPNLRFPSFKHSWFGFFWFFVLFSGKKTIWTGTSYQRAPLTEAAPIKKGGSKRQMPKLLRLFLISANHHSENESENSWWEGQQPRQHTEVFNTDISYLFPVLSDSIYIYRITSLLQL